MEFVLANVMEKAQKININIHKELDDYEVYSGKKLEITRPPKELFNIDGKVKIVFVGQYSAGKSTILKMLTGIKNIAIGAGITTQKSSIYEWKNIEIVDTPGIATGIRLDHDKIAYDAIATADLLVFVVTNELFTPLVLENFQKLAYDLNNGDDVHCGKANEMILVVNKMERIGNTREKQQMLLQALHDAGVPENISVGFVDAQSYVDSIEEDDDEIKDELVEASGYKSLVQMLNDFAERRGLQAKVISPIKNLQDFLYNAIDLLDTPIDDSKLAGDEHMLKNAVKMLRSANREGCRNLEDIFSKYAHEIRTYGNAISADIENVSDENELKREIESRMKIINRNCKREVEDEINAIAESIEREINTIFNNRELQAINIDTPNENNDNFNLNDSINKVSEVTKEILSKINKDVILQIGHFLGHKFQPWEAAKYFKWFSKLNKWLPIIGEIISLIFDVWDNNKKEEARRTLERIKIQIRSSFDEVACDLEQTGRLFIDKEFSKYMNEMIEVQDKELAKFDELKKNQSSICLKLKNNLKDINKLIKQMEME